MLLPLPTASSTHSKGYLLLVACIKIGIKLDLVVDDEVTIMNTPFISFAIVEHSISRNRSSIVGNDNSRNSTSMISNLLVRRHFLIYKWYTQMPFFWTTQRSAQLAPSWDVKRSGPVDYRYGRHGYTISVGYKTRHEKVCITVRLNVI